MLHPDSHNMFDNGSFLRRRRRFKQEAANAAHRNQQSSAGGGGGRQRGQGNHRSSPSLISPSSTTTAPNHLGDTRPNGTKTSRARNQVSHSAGKDSIADDVDCAESPRKARKTRPRSSSESTTPFSLSRNNRNMPVDMQLRRWSRWRPVNLAIIFHRTAFHHPRRRPKRLRCPTLSRAPCPISISLIRWRWQPLSTNNQVARHRLRPIHRILL